MSSRLARKRKIDDIPDFDIVLQKIDVEASNLGTPVKMNMENLSARSRRRYSSRLCKPEGSQADGSDSKENPLQVSPDSPARIYTKRPKSSATMIHSAQAAPRTGQNQPIKTPMPLRKMIPTHSAVSTSASINNMNIMDAINVDRSDPNNNNIILNGKKIKLIKIKKSQINYSKERDGAAVAAAASQNKEREEMKRVYLNLNNLSSTISSTNLLRKKRQSDQIAEASQHFRPDGRSDGYAQQRISIFKQHQPTASASQAQLPSMINLNSGVEAKQYKMKQVHLRNLNSQTKKSFAKHVDIDGLKGFRERSCELKMQQQEAKNIAKANGQSNIQKHTESRTTPNTQRKQEIDNQKLEIKERDKQNQPEPQAQETRLQELKKSLSHVLFKHTKRKLVHKSSASIGLTGFQTPSKRLMRERSSPGIRGSITYSTDGGGGNEGDGRLSNLKEYEDQQKQFDFIYKSVQNIGGIGSAKSSLNIDGRPPKIPLVKAEVDNGTARRDNKSRFATLIPQKTLARQKYSSTTDLGNGTQETQFFTTKIMKSNSSCKFILPKNSTDIKKAVESSLERLKQPGGSKQLKQIPMMAPLACGKTTSSTPNNLSQIQIQSLNGSPSRKANQSSPKKAEQLPSRFAETASRPPEQKQYRFTRSTDPDKLHGLRKNRSVGHFNTQLQGQVPIGVPGHAVNARPRLIDEKNARALKKISPRTKKT